MVYLDDRPVTAEEKQLNEVWQEGGRGAELKLRAELRDTKKEAYRQYVESIKDTGASKNEKL